MQLLDEDVKGRLPMRKLLLVLPAIVIVTVALIRFAPSLREDPSLVTRADIHHNTASRAIRARLVDELGPAASGIVVGVEKNVAVLSGAALDRRVIARAEEIAMSVGGIVVVHNFLELAPGAPDIETLREPVRIAASAPDMTIIDLMTPVGIEK
jgi:hypothetical protein